MIELLSPAGSMEALIAAVQNGADAVYLGCGSHNARAGAKNFTPDELPAAVSYCHVRGVKVHLTVNTLTTDREQVQIAELIRLGAEAGVDAFIVQDPGIVRLCRAIAPQVAVHASTQMGVHSLDGVKAAAAMGCTRVVLARELDRAQIAYICRESPVEIEVFCHGALCMCVSGQCYLSSLIGRRSGNRGRCAQPCRLPYGYGRREERYPLSLKDNCLVGELQELSMMGVASVKIEGRMKRPEYVAVVTRIYREALSDGRVTAENAARLERVFSRQGFTQGYYEHTLGQNMFGTRQDLRPDRELLAQARATYESGELARVGVKFYALLRTGEPAKLAVEDPEGRRCVVTGDVPEAARTHALTEEALAARLAKTGGTPYFSRGLQGVIDPGLSLSASAVNTMRRELLTQLSALRGRPPEYRPGVAPAATQSAGAHGAPVLTVYVTAAAQITPRLLGHKPAVLYVPLSELTAHREIADAIPAETELCAVVPRVVTDTELPEVEKALAAARAHGVKSALCGNLGHVAAIRRAGLRVRGDFGLNVFSSAAAEHWHGEGLASVTASFEASLPQLRDMSKPLPMEMLIYGRLPLMLTENCLIKNRSGVCACDGAAPKLVDRKGEAFPVVRDCGTCRSVLLAGRKLYLLDKTGALARMGLWALRLQFTTESPQEVDAVIKQYDLRGAFDPATQTRGLYLRGVE